MAKRWLLNLLTKVLGEFVELNETNLNLAVWSGQIVLKNVSLKTDKLLREFNFKVYHGVIQQLEVTIPWTTLLINPVKIVVKGVLLDVGPLDISQHSMVERIQRFLEEKMRKIKMLEKYLDLYLSLDSEHASSGGAEAAKKGSEESSYYQQWTTKIVDNIEVKISQVHVRYEDKLSVPDRCFACGITFQSYGISTLDADWNPSSSTSTAGAASVYKLAYMKSVGVYWQPDATSISHLPLREWQELMMHMIYNSTNLTLQDVNLPPYSKTPASSMQKGLLTSDASLVRDLGGRSSGSGLFDAAGINDDDDDDDSNHHVLPVISREAYLLLPYNNTFTLKMIHNKKPVGNTPRFDVAASSSKLKVAFDSTQYVQLFAIIDRIHALGKVHLPFGLRPRERPVGYDMVRAWWQYAAKLVIKEKKYVSLMKRKMKWLACERKKKLEEENGSKPDPANIERITREMRMYALTQREQRELDEMDMRVPFGSIRVFRQNAALQLAEEARRKRESETSAATSNGTSWLGSWLGYKDTPVVPHSTEKDIPIGSIVQALNNSDGNGSNPSSSSNLLHGDAASIGSGTLVKLKLTTSSQLSIFSRAVPIIESTTAVSLSFAKCTEGMSLSVNLNDFEVLDKFTASPTMPHLISVQKTSVAQLSQRVLPRHQFSDSIDGSRAFAKGVLSTDSSDELRDQKATCSVSFDKVDDKSVLTIAALPITLCLNHDCIFKLFTDFSRPPNRHAKKHTRRSSTNLHAKDAQRTPRQPHAAPGEDRDRTRGRKTSTPAKFQRTATAKVFKQMIPTEAAAFEIIFEANAPKIIVPEDCCSERGFLLMDTGYLVMKGAVGSGGMTLNLSLADIHAALPRTVQDMNSIREKSLYLIKVSAPPRYQYENKQLSSHSSACLICSCVFMLRCVACLYI